MEKEDIKAIVTEMTKQLKSDETMTNLGNSVANLSGQMIGVQGQITGLQSAVNTLSNDNRSAFKKIDGLHSKLDKRGCGKADVIESIAINVVENEKQITAVKKDIAEKTGFAKGINWTVVVLGGLFLTICGIVVAMIFF